MVKTQFGLEVSPQLVQRYDPTTGAGFALSEGLVSLFHATRKTFIESIELQPLAHRAVRLTLLNELLVEARQKGERKTALGILAESRKQMQDLEEYDDDEGEGEQGGVERAGDEA
jgi:hypothetical protein